jgi:AraC-like DNA-binding protein
MDPLSDVLSLLHVEDAKAGRIEAGGRWAMHGYDQRRFSFCALLRGSCWLATDDLDRPIQVEAGDCFALSGDSGFRICNDLTAEAVDFHDALMESDDAVIRLGTGSETSMIGGRFTFDDVYARPLLDLLPSTIYIRSTSQSAAALRSILNRLEQELDSSQLGKALVVDHLAHAALVHALRAYVACKNHPSQGWLGALADAKIGEALRLMHEDVAKRWTVADLAGAVGMSRSGFALRFKQLVALAPLDYLLQWRMHLATRALLKSNRSISSIAFDLGYDSESAFSNAFKRVMGCSPKTFRLHQQPALADRSSPATRKAAPALHPENGTRLLPSPTHASVSLPASSQDDEVGVLQ